MERPTVDSSGLTSRLKFVIPKVATAFPEEPATPIMVSQDFVPSGPCIGVERD